ncbi:hypothetical protein BG003_006293, partial [Podila horticola]
MDKDSFMAVATAAAVGLGLAGIAIQASRRKAKTGREPWNLKTDFTEYDYIIVGSHSINGMMYTRGPKVDYDYWATELEDQSWSYKEVLPYFKKSECFHDPSLPADHPLGPRTSRVYRPEYDTFEPEYHGTEGPWKIAYHHLFKSAEGFVRANEAMCIRRNPDPNGESIMGVCRIQSFIQPDGYRNSASIAFLGDPKVVPGGGDRGTVRIVTK